MSTVTVIYDYVAFAGGPPPLIMFGNVDGNVANRLEKAAVPPELSRSGGDDGGRGLSVDHSTIARRVLYYAPILNRRIRSEMRQKLSPARIECGPDSAASHQCRWPSSLCIRDRRTEANGRIGPELPVPATDRVYSQGQFVRSKGMGKPATLLQLLCGHAVSFGAQMIGIECRDRREWVCAYKDGIGVDIANYASSSVEGKELCGNLYAAAKRPVRTVFGGRAYILKVRAHESSGEGAFQVSIDPAPKLDPSITPSFTKKQGQYLAFIDSYTRIHRKAPAESDLERYFQVSPPSIHDMIKTLERNGLIERTPGRARSIRLLVQPEYLPRLE
jgi:hypothetical protein